MKTTTLVFLAAIGHAFAAVVTQPELHTEINGRHTRQLCCIKSLTFFTDINILGQDAAQPADVPVVLRPKGRFSLSSGPSRPRRKDILLEDGVADTTTEGEYSSAADTLVEYRPKLCRH